ncbi:PASTA domain protein [Aeromicrobium marinum DSM 15272]|uniref:non-specific serine/threonine protein kinase n=1 Tax=Aeromicrobium marinum DSM 15272 TaxID=585531 RepID=E2SAK9_9ACTN|nr:Stk1 family PASTA domain-containing Ser/Thr kinase [Aeromicrobium marinum]EFQ83405.1 PASTA domain protein [Aeromicrobium marinum DSM 15272]
MGDEALVGRVLDGRYLITERIARGGMASVFLAEDQRLDRQVAVKVMHRGLGDAAVFTERFRSEAKAAAKLNHRNVVAVFDQGSDGDITYLVMEFVPGRTLRDVMRTEAPMPSLRALDLVEQVLIALSAAHEAHLVHRDVKPENVLITPDGEVKVADFGLARAVSTATTATGNALIGTVSYLAPEIVVNAGTDARSDVYAVGAMTYEMLTGVKPHQGDSPIQVAYKHVHEDIGPPSDLRPGLPDYVDALVARATARDRDQRSADARVLLQQLRRVQLALRQGVDDDAELAADLRPSGPGVPLTAGADEITAAVGGAGEDEQTVTVTGGSPSTEHTAVLGGAAVAAAAPPATPATAVDTPPRTPADRQRRRGRRLLVAVVVLTLLAGGLGYYYGVGRFVDTPALVNLTEQQAIAEAEQAGFTLEVTDREFSETVPLGSVISTDPAAGERILPESTISAVVSSGPERYAVPDLTGRTLDEARALLAEANLELGAVTETFDQEVPEGQIISLQGVAVGDLVKKETTVDVLVSQGREPLEVTDFTGSTEAEATQGLQDIGFEVGVERQFSDDVAEGVVISQSPASGTVLRGDTVTIVVSQGPELFEVPNVVGQRRNDAEAALEAAGFEVDVIGRGNFTVLGQFPGAGSMQERGATVSITGL